ncbi:MAG: cytochrome c3 family protein [Verrucomicrobia bacterium]|nr:cytochrome c3 family protein [Verrucomicrobiota bacterium]
MSRKAFGVPALAGLMVASCAVALVALADPPKSAKPADNSYCYVCHANFQTEELARSHQKHGVGCATCHGESDRHSADEDGLTPPEIMFVMGKILDGCSTCHDVTKLRVLKEHEAAFTRDPAKLKVCTNCHGSHRMAVRTRQWDKTTGKLIKAEGVRMMQKDTPATSAK